MGGKSASSSLRRRLAAARMTRVLTTRLPTRRLTPLLALLLTLGSACAREQADVRPEVRPNVLLVTLDTSRADHFGAYGYELDTTPHFDRLAADGVKFTQAIAQASLTMVSHASFFTGQYPPGHGLRVAYATDGYRLDDGVPTTASVLREHGWRTQAFLSSFTVSDFFGLHRGFDAVDDGLKGDGDRWSLGTDRMVWDVKKNQRRSDDTTDQVLAWLPGAPEPFFLWIHYWDPHDKQVLPPAAVVDSFPPRAGAHKAADQAIYDAELHFVDRQLGRVLDALRSQGRYDRTLIVVVADHGQGLGDHGWWTHRILYQEQIRVPLVIKPSSENWPAGGTGPRGTTVDALVRGVDLHPTVLDLAGLEPPADLDGRSLRGLMEGRTEPPRTAYAELLAAYDANSGFRKLRPRDALIHAFLDGPWKIIVHPQQPEANELYNLESDPGELENLYAARPAVARRMTARLRELDPFVSQPFTSGAVDTEAYERLKALGYVE